MQKELLIIGILIQEGHRRRIMNPISEYLNFIREKGRPLSEINPGSSEIALTVDHAIRAIELLRGTQSAILGGDVLSDESGTLAYTYENWYSEKLEGESQADYSNKSYDIARNYINEVVKRHGKNRYIVLVIEE
jgi:hypothetical protein